MIVCHGGNPYLNYENYLEKSLEKFKETVKLFVKMGKILNKNILSDY